MSLERLEIFRQLTRLPIKSEDRVDNSQLWGKEAYGTNFVVAKVSRVDNPPEYSVAYVLNIAQKDQAEERILQDFEDTLGQAELVEIDQDLHCLNAVWFAEPIDRAWKSRN